MEYWIEWQIKAAIIVALMVIVFAMFFGKDGMFNRNRFWLLGAVILPWIVPLIAMPAMVKNVLFAPEKKDVITTLSMPVTNQSAGVAQSVSSINWLTVLLGIYLLVTAVFAIRLLWGYIYLVCLKFKARKLEYNGVSLYLLKDKDINPFSFFRSVFVSESIMQQANRDYILNHERAHCLQWHSVDIMLAEGMLLLMWWNPFAWWLRKLIAQNHEFCVDKTMMQTLEEPKQYQYALINYLPGRRRLKLVNNFSQSLIKKRIVMMNNSRNNKFFTSLKSVAVMVVTGLMLGAFTNPEKGSKTKNDAEIKDVKELQKYVAQNITYPREALENNGEGNAVAQIKVNGKGNISKIKFNEDNSVDVAANEVVVVGYSSSKERGHVSEDVFNAELKKVLEDVPQIVDEKMINKTLNLKVKFVLQEKEVQDNPSKAIIYLDGKRYYGDINSIPPDGIQSINVIKGEDAVAKYGEDHRNGVIEIASKEASASVNGVLSIRLTNDKGNPLYLIDGKEISNDELKSINPDQIESVSVLKDDSAVKLYGDKGKDGVVIIELKK